MSTEPKWYVLHTFSGYEAVAKQNLEQVVENGNLQSRIFDIVIPTEDVIEEKKSQLIQQHTKELDEFDQNIPKICPK